MSNNINTEKKDLMIGRNLGDFLVKEKLGEGGFGAVYKATQMTLEREAVIKVLHIKHRTDKNVIKRFKREAHLASRLEHPYAAHIYSFGAESDGLLWIAMEYVTGTSLDKILKTQRILPLEKFVPLLDKICEVVHTAHERGIIHRDIKPANVMIISRAGRLLPKLLDFGIAKDLNQTSDEEKTIATSEISKKSYKLNNQETFIDNVLTPKETFIGSCPLINNNNLKSQNIIIDKVGFNAQNTMTESVVNQNTVIDKIGFKTQNTIIEIDIKKNTVIDKDEFDDQNAITQSIKQDTVITSDSLSDSLKNQEISINNNKITNQETLISNQNKSIQNVIKLSEEIVNNKESIIDIKVVKNNINIETLKTQGFIGSPPYMSPEQWQNENVDARSDIYSLGILAYKAISGEFPFKEKGFELYGSHIYKEVPPLKEGFPAKVNEVLQKALAKKPQERYQTVLEFAKEFRQAANFNEEKTPLPEFDEIIKENLLTNAPKPLAESVASLIASQNANQFKDRVLLVFRALIHYLGILSLASYTSIPNEQQNNELVNKSISILYKGALNEAEWIELSRELCRSFAKKRDAFPIPELVSLFFADNGDSLSSINEVFNSLLQLQEKITAAISLNEDTLIGLLEIFLSKIILLINKVSWICDYYLVQAEGKQATKWMGIAKNLSQISVKSSNLANEKAMLVDANGHFVLLLWPLVEIIEPSLGAAKEVFLLDGKSRNGAKLVSFPQGFEIDSQSAFDWAKEHFFGGEERAKTDSLFEKSPYLGLASFSPEDSRVFFGREKETESFLNRLKVQPLLVVVGASGAGKSSFIQAGVIASLDTDWKVITIRPGISPISTLSAKLSNLLGIEIINLKSELEKDIEYLAKRLRKFAITNNSKILIVVDQFEEIFTLCLEKVEQRLYVEALVSLARSEEDPIRVVLTMRDDFLVRAKELNALKDRLNQSIEILTTPDSTQLLRILILPIRRIEYEFEDSNLPIEIVNELSGQASALPLLAFTASKLWEQRDTQFKQLRRRHYQSMGGVVGALAHHAESMFLQMTHLEQSLVREAFRHLVTSQGTRAILTRLELLQLLGKTQDSEAVIEKLIQARLLVATEGEKGIDRIEIIHEALLSVWPRLVNWRQEDVDGARLCDQLRSAARQWQERNRPKGLLWRDELLTEYQLWRTHYKGKLTEVEEEFAQASLSDATRNQRIKRTLVVTTIIILLIASGVLFYQRQQTEKQLLRTLELYEEQGRQELVKGNLDNAAVYLSEAYAQGRDSLALRYMLSIVLAKVENHPPIVLDSHTEGVMMAVFSPDNQLVVSASADKTAKIWKATDGKELFTLKGHKDTVLTSQFSPDGKLVVTSSLDKTAKIWKVSDGSLMTTLSGHIDGLRAAIFSPDGKQIITISYDKTAKIWETATGNLISTLTGHEGAIYAASYSKDGKLIATASSDKTAKIWDSSSGKLETTLTGHQASVMCLAFSPNKLLVTGSADKTAKVWQIPEGKLLFTLEKHKEVISSVQFNVDGKIILTTSKDKTACLWDIETGDLINNLLGHASDIGKGEFSPDGKLVITSAYKNDNTAKIWEIATGSSLVTLSGQKESLSNVVFSSDGKKVLVASLDKTIKIWNLVPESRSPKEVSLIIKEKVPIDLKEGKLVSRHQKINTEQVKKQNINIENIKNKSNENTYIETLDNLVKIEMVKIEGGTFEMGSPPNEKGYNSDQLLHKVTISPFYIGKYEVTQEQWNTVASLPMINTFLTAYPSNFNRGGQLPVEEITWFEAAEFCARLSKLTGKTYRLPTEAEWEYAARSANKVAPIENLDEMAWYEKNSEDKTHPVGQKKPNALGLYDMYGNVWEWCNDWYGDYSNKSVIDPKGPKSGSSRVLRGGSWQVSAINCRAATRYYIEPHYISVFVGFRVVRE